MPEKNELRERIGKEICTVCNDALKDYLEIRQCTLKNCRYRDTETDKILAAVRERVKGLPEMVVDISQDPWETKKRRVVIVSDLLRELGEESK